MEAKMQKASGDSIIYESRDQVVLSTKGGGWVDSLVCIVVTLGDGS